jgi:cytochrome c-type biogenesis protein CcmH
MRRASSLALLAVLLVASACDRNIGPYDPDEKVEQPDLSRIFPEGAERSGDAQAMRGAMPPPAPGPEPAAPASGAGEPLSGTIRIARDLESRVPSGAVLFLIARTGGGGPPTAVRRIEAPHFPLEFEIGPDDRMLEQMPFAGPFQLVVRVDADRNAMTKNPGDLQGEAKGSFAPGASGIEIVIDEVL